MIRIYREEGKLNRVHFFRNLRPEDFLKLMIRSRCIVGNSSVSIREASFLGVPAVNIGSRQQFRERGLNVIDVDHDRHEIARRSRFSSLAANMRATRFTETVVPASALRDHLATAPLALRQGAVPMRPKRLCPRQRLQPACARLREPERPLSAVVRRYGRRHHSRTRSPRQ